MLLFSVYNYFQELSQCCYYPYIGRAILAFLFYPITLIAMILTRATAFSLFQKLDNFCKENGIKVATNANGRYIRLARIILQRYKYVILVKKNHDKVICYSPKYLKKWAMKESLKKVSPLSHR